MTASTPWGAVTGVLAGVLGFFVYNRRVGRKGAWAGALLFTLILTIVAQIVVPAVAYVLAWPLLVGAIGAAATSLSAKRGPLSFALLIILAAVALGWEGGISHFAYEGMDMMALFSLQMITAGVVLWPLAQPDAGARKGLFIGTALLLGGIALTLFVRSDDPWTPRYPQVTYVGYQLDQDTGRAWRYSPADGLTVWTDQVLRADNGEVKFMRHWAWRQPMRAAAAKPIVTPPPTITLQRGADGALHLNALPPAGARTLSLQFRATTPGRIVSLGGVPVQVELVPGKWVRLRYEAAANGVDLSLQPSGPGRLDVRYVAGIESWPAEAVALPRRPADVMAWDNSDSTFVAGTRAFTW